MWWQGWTAYSKTSWESCPAYGIRTYIDGESTEAADTLKSSSCIQIIGYNENPRNEISTYGLLSDLCLDQCSIPKQFDRLALKDINCFTCHHVYNWYPFKHNNTFTFEEACAYGTYQQINGYVPLLFISMDPSSIIWTHSHCYFQLPI